MPSAVHMTHASDRLTKRELCAYGVGILAYQYPHIGLAVLALPLFNLELGLDPALVGAILMVARIWEAFLNPVVGALSDNTRSRWGRRRPYIVVGAILCSIAYTFVWFVPRSWSADALSVYLLGALIFLFTPFAFYSVPYIALGYELTPDSLERTRIQAWRTFFNIVPTFTVGWFYWICQRPVFGDLLNGARWLSVGVGLTILVAGLIPGLCLRERYYRVAASVSRESLWVSARATLANRPFLVVMAIIVTLTVGTSTTDVLSFYVLTYHVLGGDTAQAGQLMGYAISLQVVAAFVAIPAVRVAERFWGKSGALRFCVWINIVAAAAKWWLATPAHPSLWVLIPVFTQFGSLGFWMLVNSMKADICDYDELNSGRRREGSYGAIGNLLQKGALALTLFLGAAIVQALGFRASLGGAQDPATIFWLRIVFSGMPILFLTICLWLVDHYPIDGKMMGAIRVELERRRAAV